MQLVPRKLRVRNFCQYREADIQFPTGTVGVFGPVGSGKTNLFDTALYFGLFGKTADDTPIPQLLNWHCGEKDGLVELSFGFGDREYVLTRCVASGKRSLLCSGDKRPITSAVEIQTLMCNMLGMEIQTCREASFIGQGKFSEVITATHSARMEYFQKLLGLDKAETLRNMLLDGMGRLPVFMDRTQDCVRLESEINEARQEQQTVAALIRTKKRWLEENRQTYELGQKQVELPSLDSVEQQIRDAAASLEEAVRAYDAFSLERPAEVPKADPPSVDLRRLAGRIRSEKPLLQERKESVEKELGTIGAGAAIVSCQNEETKQTEAQKAVGELKALYELAVTGTCPTCKRPYELPRNREDIIREYKKAEATLQTANSELQRARTAQQQQTQKLAEWRARKARLEQELSRTKVSLAALEKASAGVNPEDVERQDAAALFYSKYLEALRGFEPRLAEFEKARDLATEALEKANLLVGITEEDRTGWRDYLGGYEQQREETRDLEFQVERLGAQISEKQAQLEQFKAETEKARRIAGERAVFEATRALFHRDVLPKRVMKRLIDQINLHMTENLGRFHVNFSAYLNDDLDFVYEQGTSGLKPCSRLSGGQKVLLALAFRLAAATVISPAFPVLVLDEPTIHLDDDTVEFMADVMTDLQEHLAKNMTLFVLTHEDRLRRAMQSTIDTEQYNRTV